MLNHIMLMLLRERRSFLWLLDPVLVTALLGMQLGSAILGAEMRHVSDFFISFDSVEYTHRLTASTTNAAWSAWARRPTATECTHHCQEIEWEEGHCRCRHCQFSSLSKPFTVRTCYQMLLLAAQHLLCAHL